MREDKILEIAKTAAKKALACKSDFIQAEFDKRYQDVKLLMRNYRKLKAYYSRVDAEALEELRRWEVLYLRYMADKRMNVDDIADSLNINKRTLYRDTERAMEDMAVLLFGIEAIGTWKHKAI